MKIGCNIDYVSYGEIVPLGNGCHEKQSVTALQIKILTEKTNDIYRYARSSKLNLVNHISLMFG